MARFIYLYRGPGDETITLPRRETPSDPDNGRADLLGGRALLTPRVRSSRRTQALACCRAWSSETMRKAFISSTDHTSSFEALASVSSDIDPEMLTSEMSEAAFVALDRCAYPLSNGKALVRQDFSLSPRP